MKFIDREIEIAILTPSNVTHFIEIEFLEFPFIKVSVVLRMWIIPYPCAEINYNEYFVIEYQRNLKVADLLCFNDS